MVRPTVVAADLSSCRRAWAFVMVSDTRAMSPAKSRSVRYSAGHRDPCIGHKVIPSSELHIEDIVMDDYEQKRS